jgi:hypothetical protein
MIDIFPGNSLNQLFRKNTLNRWRKTYHHLYCQQDFEIAFKMCLVKQHLTWQRQHIDLDAL